MPATSLHDERVEDAAEVERGAFNAAFYELGLRLYWDKGTYEALAANLSEHARVLDYLKGVQSHLLRAYDAEFLADAVIRAKQHWQQSLTASVPRAVPEFNWTEADRGEVGF